MASGMAPPAMQRSAPLPVCILESAAALPELQTQNTGSRSLN